MRAFGRGGGAWDMADELPPLLLVWQGPRVAGAREKREVGNG